MSITVKLEAFEGPFDLLFHLIEKNKINIYDIPISLIADQFIEYIDAMQERNMENISEFLVMAATLLEIKSKMLLPSPKKEEEEEEDPREELVNKLLEYKKIKHFSEELKIRQIEAQKVFYRNSTLPQHIKDILQDAPVDISEVLDGVTLQNMFSIFQDLLKRKEKKVDTIRSGFKSVQRDIYKIEDKITYILDLLVIYPVIDFHELFYEDSDKMEIVVTFLALLELIRSKQVKIEQKNPFKDILIMTYDGMDGDETD
ncbi:segregation and condensation protein A [Defluviitalea saccharophila]|uniref:Segregation and condensation protein A n=1 Tax=Defluviitalea saccharophila TaxID=879970 RepID=A0ABZ2Y984_9FIRM